MHTEFVYSFLTYLLIYFFSLFLRKKKKVIIQKNIIKFIEQMANGSRELYNSL